MLRELNPFSGRKAVSAADGSSSTTLREGEFWAVNNVSFSLRRGECLGLIGHNGAGKSTLLKILNGLIPPDDGEIVMRGRVAALIELNAGFNPILTGRENIYNQAALLGFSKEETDAKFDAIVAFSEVEEFLDMPVQNYSSGMRVRLGFAVASQMEPDILLIDEVLAVGDVAFRFKCINAIGELMKSAAVIFVTHTMPQVFRICSEAIVMDHGNVTCHSKNVADAVAVYLSLFKGGGVNVAGSGEVKVTSVRLEGPHGNAGMEGTLDLSHGDSLRLQACLEGASEISEARLQFLLWNSEMLPAMDIMTDGLTGYLFPIPSSGSLELTAFIPRVELGTGKYSLSVIAVSADKSRVFCRHDNAAYVQVAAATASGAQVLAIAEWDMKTQPSTTFPA